MDPTVLVEGDIELGREFVAIISRARRVRLEAAFWWREDEEWRFVVATPVVHLRGRLEAYRLMEHALGSRESEFQSILDRLDAYGPSKGLITVLHVGSARHVPLNRKLRGEGVGNTVVEAAYFYLFKPKTFIAV